MRNFQKTSPLARTRFICVQNLLYSYQGNHYTSRLKENLTIHMLKMCCLYHALLFKALDMSQVLLQQTSLSYKYDSIEDVQYISLDQFLTYFIRENIQHKKNHVPSHSYTTMLKPDYKWEDQYTCVIQDNYLFTYDRTGCITGNSHNLPYTERPQKSEANIAFTTSQVNYWSNNSPKTISLFFKLFQNWNNFPMQLKIISS